MHQALQARPQPAVAPRCLHRMRPGAQAQGPLARRPHPVSSAHSDDVLPTESQLRSRIVGAPSPCSEGAAAKEASPGWGNGHRVRSAPGEEAREEAALRRSLTLVTRATLRCRYSSQHLIDVLAATGPGGLATDLAAHCAAHVVLFLYCCDPRADSAGKPSTTSRRRLSRMSPDRCSGSTRLRGSWAAEECVTDCVDSPARQGESGPADDPRERASTRRLQPGNRVPNTPRPPPAARP
jgi:hypothetical protein